MTELTQPGSAGLAGPTGRPRVRRGMVRAVLSKPLGLASSIFLAVVILLTIFATKIAPFNPLTQDLLNVKGAPSVTHLLGTDSLGRDVLSRLLVGGQDSLLGVVQALVVVLIIGVPLGVATGFLGGTFDRVVMRIIDLKMAIPGIILTLAVLAIFNNSMTAAMITFGIMASGGLVRMIRSTVLGVREELYVDAAVAIGLTRPQIIVRHILPRTVGVIIVQASMLSAIALGVQTGLSFLGFGLQPPAPTWGGMVAEASSLLQQDPWLLVPSGGIIALTTMAFGLLGDAVRDANAERYSAPPARAVKRTRRAVTPIEVEAADDGALLSVRNLTVAFGAGASALTVVEGVNFDIGHGETVGLVGESGSGKTVTALAILGLLTGDGRVAGGQVVYDGTDIASYTGHDFHGLRGSEIGMISQEPMVALDPVFRVGFQIAEAVRTHDKCSRSQAKARVLELLRAVKLPNPEKVARLYPHQISGGMAQRVAIAIALAGRPRLLIADEPTTALDVTVQAEILDLLRSLQAETGMAMLLVTHDWAVVADICTRSVVMYAGQVVERASVREMFAAPKHPYTKGLLESSPHLARKGEPLPTIGGIVPPPRAWPTGCHFAPRCPFATEECAAAPVAEHALETGRMSRCIRIDELMASTR
jgi:peptide/nickel transport system permease protein